MVIDFHAHFVKEPDFAARLVDLLPEAGIDRICLCSAGERFDHEPNAVILHAAQRYPDQLIALALVELGTDSPDVVTEYARAGFAGFKITDPRSSYDDPVFFPVYERMTGAWWGGWRQNKRPEFYHDQFFWKNAWEKVLFGTDILALHELIPSRQYHDRLIESLHLPPDTVRKIYGDTAAQLLGIGEKVVLHSEAG